MVPLAIVTGLVMMAGWFPLSTLWHQQSEINLTTAQINAIKKQDAALKQQATAVSSASAATLLAREQYQLVAPGQSLIQVLPGNGAGGVSANAGDPGFAPLVSPTSVSSLTTTATPAPKHSDANGFLVRFIRTLEFWR